MIIKWLCSYNRKVEVKVNNEYYIIIIIMRVWIKCNESIGKGELIVFGNIRKDIIEKLYRILE